MTNPCPECNLEYTGEVNPEPGVFDRLGRPLYPYLPNDELKEVVRLAIALERPLLLMGDPGCGKTRLARAIAYEFTRKNAAPLEWAKNELATNSSPLPEWAKFQEWPYQEWFVKSNSNARDGLYTYDAVKRLRDAQLAAQNYLDERGKKRLQDEAQEGYIRYGALGKAFQAPLRTVVLIDEIDKANIDFPNDLLLELDEKRFKIEETDTEVQATAPPIILITSNNERDLPDAFLRRCFFHYIKPPDKKRLLEILQAHFGGELKEIEDFLEQIVDEFLNLQKVERSQTTGKRVSTSELLDLVRALLLAPSKVPELLKQGLPFLGVLLKTPDERIRYRRQGDETK
ncbi:MAG: AAA family ATPase [Xenococcaceae cyanobacterium]